MAALVTRPPNTTHVTAAVAPISSICLQQQLDVSTGGALSNQLVAASHQSIVSDEMLE
jgi:hypothetical protein